MTYRKACTIVYIFRAFGFICDKDGSINMDKISEKMKERVGMTYQMDKNESCYTETFNNWKIPDTNCNCLFGDIQELDEAPRSARFIHTAPSAHHHFLIPIYVLKLKLTL